MNNLVLIENGLVVGTASFCKSRWEKYIDFGEIVSIYFLPDYIGKGYGGHLLEPVQYLFKERKKWYNKINKTMKAGKR